MFERALDVVFPRRCAGCGRGDWPFCGACDAALVRVAPPWCERCGCPGALSVPSCRDCPPSPVVSSRSAFVYDGPARAAVHKLKFGGWRVVAFALAREMSAVPLPEVDAITWVPLARRRRAERGYDQARALARALGRELGLPTRRLARRVLTTAQQARRGGAERRAAMRGAFAPLTTAPPRLLLVDDVLTTGATAAACAEALAAAGATEVHLVVAARSLPRAALRSRGGRADNRVGSRPGLWLPGDDPR